MSSRVSVPTTARRIGSAQPPRPFTLAGWSSWPRHRGSARFTYTLLSCSCRRVRNMSAAILSLLRLGLPCGRPHLRDPEGPRRKARLRRLFHRFSRFPKVPTCTMASSPDGPVASAFAARAGSLRPGVPTTPSNPRSRGRPVRLCSRSPTDRGYRPRLFPCHESADRLSDRIVHGYPTFRGFSPLVAAGPSRIELSSLPFPTLRCRGSEDLSCSGTSTPCDASAPLQADAFSSESVIHATVGSLLSWSLPPFEVDLPASPHTSAELLSWALFIDPSLGFPPKSPPRFLLRPSQRALFRVSENRKYGPVLPEPTSVGSSPPRAPS